MSLDLNIGNEFYNYTYNASRMWYELCPDDDGMVYIDGMTGKKAAEKIRPAIIDMVKHSKSIRELEPPNSWGSYEGFLQFLIEVLGACERHPKKRWRADR